MKTKSFIRITALSLLLTLSVPFATLANDGNIPAHRQEQIDRLQNRLEEIRKMDTKKLSREEKRELRKEVKTIKKEMTALSGGVYISIGAILLIALLLILLA